MIKLYLVPLLAVAGIVMATYVVVNSSRPPTAMPPVIAPPEAPYDAFVAGSGLVEASSQNIAVGSPVGDVVDRVAVTVGDAVRAGDVLFELDTRSQKADLAVKEASLAVAESQLAKLEAGTRPELLPPARARVSEAQSQLDDAKAQLVKWDQVQDKRAVSEDELARRRFAVRTAEARLAGAQAELSLLEAGTWRPDVEVARTQVAQARSQVEGVRTEIERRIVRAPVDGRVLQVNVRKGEFAGAGSLATPLMLVGTVSPLHLRVDVDEHEAWRVKAGTPATAYVRGNKDIKAALKFVRFEPYIVPKKSLTGDSSERVDTRVLQVIYSFEPGDQPIYVGQQMDAYIEAAPIDTGVPSSPAREKNQ